MSVVSPDVITAPTGRSSQSDWHSHPDLPLEESPIFTWPPRPIAALRYLFSNGFFWSVGLPYALLGTVTWLFLQPALERCVTLEAGWMLQMYARNLTFMVLLAGGLHLYLYTFNKQGLAGKHRARDLSRSSPRYLFNNQVWDNIFWTCASGVTIWTLYEIGIIWGYANAWLPFVSFDEHPIWFVLVFFLIPFWYSIHFYFIHRLLHWKPLYKVAHSLHHRNVNIGPWSGISMHPIEHLIYLSTVLIHLVIPSHPIHILFHLQYAALGPAASHSGFSYLMVKGKDVVALGDFFHQLHHRYFNCNYGTDAVPLDRWLGTGHDGTDASLERIRQARAT